MTKQLVIKSQMRVRSMVLLQIVFALFSFHDSQTNRYLLYVKTNKEFNKQGCSTIKPKYVLDAYNLQRFSPCVTDLRLLTVQV